MVDSIYDIVEGATTQFWGDGELAHKQFNHGRICNHPDCDNPCHNAARYCMECASLATTRKALHQLQVARRLLVEAGKLPPESLERRSHSANETNIIATL